MNFFYISYNDNGTFAAPPTNISTDRTLFLNSLNMGDVFQVIMGDPLTSNNKYTYQVGGVNPQPTYAVISVTCIAQTQANASYSPGSDVCIKVQYDCVTHQQFLDYPYI